MTFHIYQNQKLYITPIHYVTVLDGIKKLHNRHSVKSPWSANQNCKHICYGQIWHGVHVGDVVNDGRVKEYLSSSISRLDSLSESCRHKASLRSTSRWSFLCRRMFSSRMWRSSSIYWALFSVSVHPTQDTHDTKLRQETKHFLYWILLN